MLYTGLFYVFGRGMEPWTLQHGKPDNEKLQSKEKYKVNRTIELFYSSFLAADGVSEARWTDYLRPSDVRFTHRHESRRESAGSSHSQGIR